MTSDAQLIDRLEAQADRMGRDPETQALLRRVIEDERASIALFQRARDGHGG